MEALHNINDLPIIDELKRNMMGMALLDLIIMPQWEHRYFSFNSNWSEDEMMGSIRDGSGGECYIHFTKYGAIGKVALDPSVLEIGEFLKLVPEEFSGFVNESAFSITESTFIFWKRYADIYWSVYPNNLVQYDWFGTLKNGFPSYLVWAESYYEMSFSRSTMESVFRNLSVTKEYIAELNPEINLSDIEVEIIEILGSQLS